jgi:PAS domain S-box-containing protein
MITDAVGVIQTFNVGAERMLGYTASEVIGKLAPTDLYALQKNQAPVIVLRVVQHTSNSPGLEALASKITRFGDLDYLRKDSSYVPSLTWVMVLHNAHGAVLGFLLFGIDSSTRKTAEGERAQLDLALQQTNRELTHAKLMAEKASHAKSEFLATMSHEIRTPMNGVIGMLDVLQQSNLTHHQLEMVAIMRDSAFALLSCINDILDFSKIEAGKLQIDYIPFHVPNLRS